MTITRRAQRIKPSPTLEITAKAAAMQATGIDLIGFGAGEPDFDTPEHIKEAAIKALREGFTKYTPVGGINELKLAIAEKLKADNGLEYEANQIVVSCGAKHSLFNLAQALFEAGDEVLIPAPYWVSYPEQVELCDATAVFVETSEESGFRMSAELLQAHITPRSKALILNSPCNPTGAAYSREELERLAEVALAHRLYLISDEIYEKFVYDQFPHHSIAAIDREVYKRTIVVNGVSKAYAMTGWRIGYAAGPRELVNVMTNMQSQSTSNPTSIAQRASIEALRGPQDALRNMVAEFARRRRYTIDRLNRMPGVRCLQPQGAFYAFPNFSGVYGRTYQGKPLLDSSDLAAFLLQEARVAVVPGVAFGSEAHARLSYATSMQNITEGLNRIEAALAGLS